MHFIQPFFKLNLLNWLEKFQNGLKYVIIWFSNYQIFTVPIENIFRFLYWVLACSQKCEEILNFSTFISCYSQIWLSCMMDDRQFSYITNMKEKT